MALDERPVERQTSYDETNTTTRVGGSGSTSSTPPVPSAQQAPSSSMPRPATGRTIASGSYRQDPYDTYKSPYDNPAGPDTTPHTRVAPPSGHSLSGYYDMLRSQELNKTNSTPWADGISRAPEPGSLSKLQSQDPNYFKQPDPKLKVGIYQPSAQERAYLGEGEKVTDLTPNYAGLTNKGIFRGDAPGEAPTFSDRWTGATQKGLNDDIARYGQTVNGSNLGKGQLDNSVEATDAIVNSSAEGRANAPLRAMSKQWDAAIGAMQAPDVTDVRYNTWGDPRDPHHSVSATIKSPTIMNVVNDVGKRISEWKTPEFKPNMGNQPPAPKPYDQMIADMRTRQGQPAYELTQQGAAAVMPSDTPTPVPPYQAEVPQMPIWQQSAATRPGAQVTLPADLTPVPGSPYNSPFSDVITNRTTTPLFEFPTTTQAPYIGPDTNRPAAPSAETPAAGAAAPTNISTTYTGPVPDLLTPPQGQAPQAQAPQQPATEAPQAPQTPQRVAPRPPREVDPAFSWMPMPDYDPNNPGRLTEDEQAQVVVEQAVPQQPQQAQPPYPPQPYNLPNLDWVKNIAYNPNVPGSMPWIISGTGGPPSDVAKAQRPAPPPPRPPARYPTSSPTR